METRSETSDSPTPGRTGRLLERAATGLLMLVLAALGWMIIASYLPQWARLENLELEVFLIVALLVVTLLLVSVVALLHTRR